MANPFRGPVTRWLSGLRSGDEHSATELFNECERALLPLVRRSVRRSRFHTEAEDVLQSCLGRFGAKVASGEFPGVVDRDSLWAYLLTSIRNKLIEHRRRATRLRRGGGWSRSAVDCNEIESGAAPPDERLDAEEVLTRALETLPTESHRRVAKLMLLEHRSPEEIARELGCGVSTVYRKLNMVKQIWMSYFNLMTPMDGLEHLT